MDIKQEIDKHLKWIETVASLFEHEQITEAEQQDLTRHDRCALGQWLNSGSSAKYQDLPELEVLKENHEAFHKLAGDLITALVAGKEDEALQFQEKFIEKSQTVISCLQVLQEKKRQE